MRGAAQVWLCAYIPGTLSSRFASLVIYPHRPPHLAQAYMTTYLTRRLRRSSLTRSGSDEPPQPGLPPVAEAATPPPRPAPFRCCVTGRRRPCSAPMHRPQQLTPSMLPPPSRGRRMAMRSTHTNAHHGVCRRVRRACRGLVFSSKGAARWMTSQSSWASWPRTPNRQDDGEGG